jgi:hypothetical protein
MRRRQSREGLLAGEHPPSVQHSHHSKRAIMFHLRGAGTVLLSLITLAAVSGCRAREEKREEAGNFLVADSTNPKTTSTAGPTVIFHMTGLLLLVPSKAANDSSLHVLFPKESDHVPLIGFGIYKHDSHAELCYTASNFPNRAGTSGLCYMDLRRWTLEPIGSGGRPAHPNGVLPKGLLNLTALSDGQKIEFPVDTSALNAKVDFISGSEWPAHCSLATWIYNRTGEPASERIPLINVFDWAVWGPVRRALVFHLKENSDSTVTFLFPPTAPVHIVLAHVPSDELADILPNQPDREVRPTTGPAVHFDVYYNLLKARASTAEQRPRRIPRDAHPKEGKSCPIEISMMTPGLGPTTVSPRTFSCMLATADRL